MPQIPRSARQIRKQLRSSHNFEGISENPESRDLLGKKDRSLEIPEERQSVSVKMKEKLHHNMNVKVRKAPDHSMDVENLEEAQSLGDEDEDQELD